MDLVVRTFFCVCEYGFVWDVYVVLHLYLYKCVFVLTRPVSFRLVSSRLVLSRFACLVSSRLVSS